MFRIIITIIVLVIPVELVYLIVNDTLPTLLQTTEPNFTIELTAIANQKFKFEHIENILPKDLNPNECKINDNFIYLSEITTLAENFFEPLTFIYCNRYSTLYELKKNGLKMFKNENISFIEKNEMELDENCSKKFIIDENEEILYIFSCSNIYNVKTKFALTKIDKIFIRRNKFLTEKLYLKNDLILEIGREGEVNIFLIENPMSIKLLVVLKTFNEEKINIIDMAIKENYIYLLDYNKGVLIWKREQNLFVEKDILRLNFAKNENYFNLLIWKSTIFIGFELESKFVVCEIQAEEENFVLVRYFKGIKNPIFMQILDDKLTVVTKNGIESHEINEDPRLISSVNSVALSPRISNIKDMIYLAKKQFLVVTDNFRVMKYEFISHEIECLFKTSKVITFNAKKRCILHENLLFNNNCTKNAIVIVTVSSPAYDSYFWLILIILSILILFILSLAYWREKKVNLIDKILKEILKIKSRENDRVEFVEEKQTYYCKEYKEWEGTEKNSIGEDNDKEMKKEWEEINENPITDREIIKENGLEELENELK